MQRQVVTISLTTCLWLGLLMAMVLAGAPPVRFDVPPMIPAQVTSYSPQPQFPNSQCIDMELSISAFLESTFAGQVEEMVLQIDSHRRDLQVADFAPRTELATATQGQVNVSEVFRQDRDAAIQGAAAYPGVGWAKGHASFQDHVDIQKSYLEKAPAHVLTAAGTTGRRTGVYFKLRKSPQNSLEGEHPTRIRWVVPNGWRGDLLEVSCVAFGKAGHGGTRELARQRFLVAAYIAGDAVAAEVARGHVLFEQRLRAIAQQHADQIRKSSHPTPFHRLGVALDVIDPSIPSNWLEETLFGSPSQYPIGDTSRLPVDVRVAMLDYLDQKMAMGTLAQAGRFTNAQR